MSNEALQTVVKALEPELNELARNLGKTPEAVLRDGIDSQRKAWALAKLEEETAVAEASGFETIEDTLKEAEEIMAEGRRQIGS